jgi:hypothetical protein
MNANAGDAKARAAALKSKHRGCRPLVGGSPGTRRSREGKILPFARPLFALAEEKAFKDAMRALLNTPPTPMADIPKKRVPRKLVKRKAKKRG